VFDVRAAGVPVDGESWMGDGRAVFLPHGPMPADTRVSWSVHACSATTSGTFTTGALLHPLEDLEGTHVGHLFEVDLRRATWDAPTPEDELAGVLLKWHLAPSFLVVMSSVAGNEATFFLAPAVIDDDGRVAQDLTRPVQTVKASLEDNPYVALDPVTMSLVLGDGVLELRGAELLLGLSDHGLADGRLSAFVDVRGLSSETDGADPCAVLLSLTGGTCQPCDAEDTEGGCFFLEMSDVVGDGAEQRVLDLHAGQPLPTLP
jgi:hypothetical protein